MLLRWLKWFGRNRKLKKMSLVGDDVKTRLNASPLHDHTSAPFAPCKGLEGVEHHGFPLELTPTRLRKD